MSIAKLQEAKSLKPEALTGKRWKIKIIEGDRQGSSAYYPKEALEAGKHLFGKGVRIFRNHPSSSDAWEQPERRIEDIIGSIAEEATYDGKDLFAEVEFIESEQARIKELAEKGLIAMSIRASGEMTETANGMELKRFTAVHSVDVVTSAGAGGGFIEVLESARNPHNSEALAEEKLKEETELEFPKELAEAMDAQAKLVNSLLEKLNAREDAEAAKAEELAEAERKALEEAEKPKVATPAEIAEALVEAKLAPKARARVLKAVEGGADLAEAIKEEADIAAEILAEAGAEGFGSFDDGKPVEESERSSKAVSHVFG